MPPSAPGEGPPLTHPSRAFGPPRDGAPANRPVRLVGELGPVVIAVTAALAIATSGDLPWTHGVRAALALLVTQVLPGAVVWRVVRPRDGWWLEDLTMGFAIGSVLAVATQAGAGLTGQVWISAAIPLLVGATLIVVPGTRARVLAARTSPLPWWVAGGSALTAAMAARQVITYFREVPLTWSSGFRTPHVDAYLHLALSAELAHRGPATFPWVASEPLAYHWFSHGWVAQLSQSSGVPLDETLFRFMPVVMPLSAALVVAAAAVRLGGRAWLGPLAALLTLGGGDLTVFGQAVTNRAVDPLSPSLGLSVPMLVALVVVMACRWRCQTRSGAVSLVPLLAVGAAGTKGSTLPLIVAGLCLATVAMFFLNRPRLPLLLKDLALVAACLVFALVTVFHGSEGGLHLDPLWSRSIRGNSTVLARAVTLVTEVVGRSARGAGILLLLGSVRGRRDPLSWVLAGGGAAGTLAVVMFSHPGGSQGYFALSAIPLLALGSTLGLAVMVDALRAGAVTPLAIGLVTGVLVVLLPTVLISGLTVRHPARALGVIALVVAAACAVGWVANRRRAVSLASVFAISLLSGGVIVVLKGLYDQSHVSPPRTVTAGTPLAVSRDQIDAARWVRDHSGVDDIVMTNRHCTGTGPPVHCDSRRYVVAAFSERQVLLEGWTATPTSTDLAPNGRDSITIDYWNPWLLALNDGFIARPDAAAARRLRGLGVRWVVVDDTRPHAVTLEPFATLRLRNRGSSVYELGSG